MMRFGSDKPDLRFGMEIVNISEEVKNAEFKVFQDALEMGDKDNKIGIVALINAKGAGNYSRKQLDNLTEFAKKYGAKGLAYIKFEKGENNSTVINSPIAKFLKPEEMDAIKKAANAEEGDLILISSDEKYRALTILGALRLEIARQLGIMADLKNTYSFHFVENFPLFDFDAEENRYVAMHHPFTSPLDEDLDLLNTNPKNAKAKAYDLVVNGAELGGGSIRIHDSTVQNKMFELLGFSDEDIEEKFGFLLKALKYGAPPHGGIALGVDRIVMTLAGTDNIRDVIAFPKNSAAKDLMSDAPGDASEEQLRELHLKLVLPPEKKS